MSDKRKKHMEARYEHNKSLRKTAEEFGVSKSTIHRNVSMATPDQNTSKAMRMIIHPPKKQKAAPVKEAKGMLKNPSAAPSINKPPLKNPYKKEVF